MVIICADLEYGLPVKLRDYAMSIKDNTPKSDVGREYHLQNMSKEVGGAGGVAKEEGGRSVAEGITRSSGYILNIILGHVLPSFHSHTHTHIHTHIHTHTHTHTH